MGSFNLLVVQHKPEVTKLWAFKFGIRTGGITVGNRSVVQPDQASGEAYCSDNLLQTLGAGRGDRVVTRAARAVGGGGLHTTLGLW